MSPEKIFCSECLDRWETETRCQDYGVSNRSVCVALQIRFSPKGSYLIETRTVGPTARDTSSNDGVLRCRTIPHHFQSVTLSKAEGKQIRIMLKKNYNQFYNLIRGVRVSRSSGLKVTMIFASHF